MYTACSDDERSKWPPPSKLDTSAPSLTAHRQRAWSRHKMPGAYMRLPLSMALLALLAGVHALCSVVTGDDVWLPRRRLWGNCRRCWSSRRRSSRRSLPRAELRRLTRRRWTSRQSTCSRRHRRAVKHARLVHLIQLLAFGHRSTAICVFRLLPLKSRTCAVMQRSDRVLTVSTSVCHPGRQ